MASSTASSASRHFVFYTNHICPFAHRAWIALEFHKQNHGITYEEKIADLKDKPAWFSEAYSKALGADPSSNGKVPLIEHDGHFITESDIVVKYVDAISEHGSTRRLMPKDPYNMVESEVFVRKASGQMILPFYRLLNSQDPEDQKEFASKLRAAWQTVAEMLEASHSVQKDDQSDGLFNGEQLSLADVMIWPWYRRLCALKHYRNFELSEAETPIFRRLFAWDKAMRAHPAVKSTLVEDDQYFIDGYKVYATAEKKFA